MVRRFLQILIMPLLFALLGAGGKTTFCEVLSVIGLEAHHHASHGEEEDDHSGPFCLESHGDESSDHGHESVPCPESCEIRLSEGPAPVLAKLPMFCGAAISAPSFEFSFAAESSAPDFVSASAPDPPEDGPRLHVPSFTGRFLI